MSGSTRYCGENKTKYVTYGCPNHKAHTCDNKEVNLNYLNDLVLTKIMDTIFTEKHIKSIIKKLNWHEKKKASEKTNKVISLQNKITKINAGLMNLTNAIAEEGSSKTLLDSLTQLENEKAELEAKVKKAKEAKIREYTKDDINRVKRVFKKYMLKKDSIACRKFIREFIDEIVVYEDRIDVVLKTSKDVPKEDTQAA